MIRPKPVFAGLYAAVSLAAMGFLMMAAPAFADTYTTTLSGSTETIADNLGAQTEPFTNIHVYLPQFNSSLGNLTGITLTLDNSLQATIKVYDIGGSGGSFSSATASLPVTLTLTGGAATFSETATPTSTVTNKTVAPGAFPATYPGIANATTPVSSTVSSLDFSLFEGAAYTSTLMISGNTFSASQVGASGDLLFGASGNDTPTVTVTYDYTVPEPSTWLSLGAAVGAILFIGRRARKSAQA